MKVCEDWSEEVITHCRCPYCYQDIEVKGKYLEEGDEVTCTICGNVFVLGEPVE